MAVIPPIQVRGDVLLAAHIISYHQVHSRCQQPRLQARQDSAEVNDFRMSDHAHATKADFQPEAAMTGMGPMILP